jgi:flavodoxin
MKVVVVYESMFGNTHAIADAIAAGIGEGNDVVVLPVARAGQELSAMRTC